MLSITLMYNLPKFTLDSVFDIYKHWLCAHIVSSTSLWVLAPFPSRISLSWISGAHAAKAGEYLASTSHIIFAHARGLPFMYFSDGSCLVACQLFLLITPWLVFRMWVSWVRGSGTRTAEVLTILWSIGQLVSVLILFIVFFTSLLRTGQNVAFLNAKII